MNFAKQLALKLKFFWGSLFYLGYAPYAYLYSYKRDRLERQFAPPTNSEGFERPGKLLQAEQSPRGARFYFEQAELEISFLTSDFVRVDWYPSIPPIPYAIARSDWSEVETNLTQINDTWTISSSVLNVMIHGDGSLKFCNKKGEVIREENPPQRQGERWIHQAQLQPNEHIYGLGERATSLNLRKAKEVTKNGDVTNQPKTFQMWNYDAAGMYGSGADPMYICIPIYLGLHSAGGYLIFYENSFAAEFTFGDRATADFSGGALRYYLTVGSPTQLLERYTELTGRAPLPPRWALGYHQSHWGYRTEKAVREEAKAFKTHNVPLSAFHLDIDVQVGHRAFTIDPDRFPNLGGFTAELLEQGVRFIAIMNPGIKYSRHNNLFLEGQILGAFCRLPNGKLIVAPVWPGWCVFPDFTNPKVRQWWSRQYAYLLDVGVAGFWHDMNEPAAFIIWGDRSLPKVTQHYMEGRGGDHREAHNIYGLLQAKAGYESLCHYHPHQRPFIVSRAGWAGLQRYAWTWTGDVECSWAALRQTIATVVGLGLSGIPYSGPDIGGFQGNPSPELYLRWFQLSTFLTFCRTHSSNNVENRTPWTYGEPYLTIIRQFLQLRYRLLPYFYTLSWEASQKGYPPVRPLFWCDPYDSKLWDVEDAFLLGNSLLVCPIVEDGSRHRSVMLPQGHWYNFWDDTLIEGGQVIDLEVTLDQIPLFVKAGTLLPMEEGQEFILHVYPPIQDTSQTDVYMDANDGYGDSRIDQFQMVRSPLALRSAQSPEGLEVTWKTEGDYPFPYTDVQLHFHGIHLEEAWIDDQKLSIHHEQLPCQPFKKAYFKGTF